MRPCLRAVSFLSHSQPLSVHMHAILSRNYAAENPRLTALYCRLMSSQINARLFRPGLLPSVLQAIRSALFPDNALAAARVPPTSAELVEMKRECANTILDAIPGAIRSRFFGTKDQDLARQDVENTLDLFSDAYINKHLIISAVELIVVRLFPELAEHVEE